MADALKVTAATDQLELDAPPKSERYEAFTLELGYKAALLGGRVGPAAEVVSAEVAILFAGVAQDVPGDNQDGTPRRDCCSGLPSALCAVPKVGGPLPNRPVFGGRA